MTTAAPRPFLCAVLLGAQLLSGCALWLPARVTPTSLTEAGNPDKVRIKQADGSTFVLHSPTILADTLSGQVDAQPRRVPLATVTEMAFRKITWIGVVGPAVAIFVAMVALEWHAARGT